MGTFYGNLQGNRGAATRVGSRDSGIMASARSFLGSVTVTLFGDERKNGDHLASIWSSVGSHVYGRCLYRGPLGYLVEADHLLPAQETDVMGEPALLVQVNGVGCVQLVFEQDDDEDGTTVRQVTATVVSQ